MFIDRLVVYVYSELV